MLVFRTFQELDIPNHEIKHYLYYDFIDYLKAFFLGDFQMAFIDLSLYVHVRQHPVSSY